MKTKLAGTHASPLEHLLVDVVGTTYLAALYGETAAASQPAGSTAQLNYRLRRAEAGQRRFLRASKTLATVAALLSRGRRSG
jgi:hypothetical protein